MAACMCAIRNADGKVEVERSGWMKYYITKQFPHVPSNLSDDGEGVHWLNGIEGYVLVRCPQCATKAGKARHFEAGREAA